MGGTKAVMKFSCRHTTSLTPFNLRSGLGQGATSNILGLNTSENGEIYFACTRLVLPTNSMQSLHDGDRWTWQDHLALQVKAGQDHLNCADARIQCGVCEAQGR